MNLKNILKQLKNYESSISTVLGFILIVVMGLLVVNYFRNMDVQNGTAPDDTQEQIADQTIHTIAEGESLWTIAEQYYNDGFKWTEIMQANNIANPGDIEVGQEIVIPTLEEEAIADAGEQVQVQEENDDTQDLEEEGESEPEPQETSAPAESEESAEGQPGENLGGVEEQSDETMEDSPESAEGEESTYTVVRGDTLWDIAQEHYGDGYRWTDIAEANDLVNPHIIHAGNVLVLPA